MPLRTNLDEPAGLNMTPMIDMVFNLLIFFLVATKYYDVERELDVQLPQVGTARPLTAPPQEIVVNIFRDGTLIVDANPVTNEALAELLRQARSRYEDQAVLVRGDAGTVYQRVADVLSICESVGITRLSLSVKQEKP